MIHHFLRTCRRPTLSAFASTNILDGVHRPHLRHRIIMTINQVPDADVHPVATGAAKKVVEDHQTEQELKLYGSWFCPFVQRIWTVLEEKQIPYQYIEVNPYHKPESLLKLNPRGLVPTLQYKNKPLYESSIVAEFLEHAYRDHKPSLLPQDPYDRAWQKIWIDFASSRIATTWLRVLQAQGGGQGLEDLKEEFRGHLLKFTEQMSEQGPFFNGRDIAMVDLIIAPWAIRIWILDHFKGGHIVPEVGQGGEREQVWARWRQWVQAIGERPSLRNTTSEREYYMPIYQRYAEDKAQSEMAKAIRSGGVVP